MHLSQPPLFPPLGLSTRIATILLENDEDSFHLHAHEAILNEEAHLDTNDVCHSRRIEMGNRLLQDMAIECVIFQNSL